MHAMPTVPPIPTPRFELVSMSLPFMQALLARDIETAAAEIGAAVPADMPDDLEHFLQFRIARPERRPDGPALARPGDRARRRRRARQIIGSVGFHAPPDERRAGSRSATAWSRPIDARASRREVVRALFDWACREHGVTRFRAATSPDNVASQAVLAPVRVPPGRHPDGRDRRRGARLRARRLDRDALIAAVP